MNDPRDITERLLYPSERADRRRLMREAANYIAQLREMLEDSHHSEETKQVIDAHERFTRQ